MVSGDATARVRRRLAAILVAGYGPLFPGDEMERFAELRAVLAEIIEPLAADYDGKIFKQAGELALLEFESVVEATRCAAACMRWTTAGSGPASSSPATRPPGWRQAKGG